MQIKFTFMKLEGKPTNKGATAELEPINSGGKIDKDTDIDSSKTMKFEYQKMGERP